ncbi:hypothetical protein [Pseudomonas aeruginosa]
MISRQSFGLLWLNPPYGDLVADHSGASQYQGSGRDPQMVEDFIGPLDFDEHLLDDSFYSQEAC